MTRDPLQWTSYDYVRDLRRTGKLPQDPAEVARLYQGAVIADSLERIAHALERIELPKP